MSAELKAVLVGCGGMSGHWLSILAAIPEVRIVALADILEENARRKAAEASLPDARLYSDYRQAIETERPDVVFDCTIPEVHHGVTLTALGVGAHVLGEKPLADSMPHAREMVAAAVRAGRTYAVIQNRRYDANIRRLRAFLESGAIGQVTTVDVDFYDGAHFGGFRERMDNVLLLDMAIHTLDAARLLSGADPLSVICRQWNPAGSWFQHGASAAAIFSMTGGVVINYRGSWCAEGFTTGYEGRWRIIGTRGTALWDGAAGIQAVRGHWTSGFNSEFETLEIPPHDPGPMQGGHAGQIRDFIDCLLTGRTPETAAADNIRSLAMVFGAIESDRQGRAVDIVL